MKPDRFTGTVQPLMPIYITELIDWITSIPLENWPQQHKENDQLRPAMVNDMSWRNFGEKIDNTMKSIMEHFPECYSTNHMLSTLMPSASIRTHSDLQQPNWVSRVHVPLITDKDAFSVVGGEQHHMTPGLVYQFNTYALHGSYNNGTLPRIHFLFDVLGL